MSKKLNFAAKVKGMKPGDQFVVANEKDRQSVLRAAKELTRAGVVTLRITTFAHCGGFKVAAI